jgi:cardiolipin synthase C
MFGSGGASLHTKAFVEDGALAGQLREEHRRLIDPARSWLVELESHRLTWRGQVEGHMLTFRAEPDTTLLRRLLARVLGWLTIEPQL